LANAHRATPVPDVQARYGRVITARQSEPSQYTPLVPCVGQIHTPVTGGGNVGAAVGTTVISPVK